MIQRYSGLFQPILSGAEIVARQKAGERNPGGEKTGLNGFPFMRYIWDRYILRAEQYDRPIDVSEQIVPVKFGKFVKLYSCTAVLDDLSLQMRYLIKTVRQLDELEALSSGDSDEEFLQRFAGECVVDEIITFESAVKSFATALINPDFGARMSVFRKAARRAATIFEYYDRLLVEGVKSVEKALTPKGASVNGRQDNPLFSDNSRDSLQLLEQEQGRLTAMRQSPERSDSTFFDDTEQMPAKLAKEMLQRYKPYWQKMLNRPGSSITEPEVYDIVDTLNRSATPDKRSAKDTEAWARLQEVLFDENPRFVLKATRVTEDLADEIAHEIRCGYHLNELNLGYTHVLTPHFMQIADWWCTRRRNMPQGTLSQKPDPADPNPIWQFTVSEKLTRSIADNLCGDEGMDGLRARLFQVLVSLEVAWLANRYVHYDLHSGNVFMKQLEPTSSLYDKGLCYKRFNNDQEWYCLEASVLHNSIVKILDFGRNRMQVPSPNSDKKKSGDGDTLQHNHNKLLFKSGFEKYGVSRDPNLCWDTRRLLIDVLFGLKSTELVQIERDPDYDAFCELCDAVFRFDRLDEQLRVSTDESAAKSLALHPFRKYATSTAGVLQGRSLSTNLRSVTVFKQLYLKAVVWSPYDSGATPTSLLDMRFFDALKRTEISDSQKHVIVSFPTADLEATLLPAVVASHLPLSDARVAPRPQPSMMMRHQSGRVKPKCHLCDKDARKRSDYNNERLDWCGPVCYQFHYHHDRKSAVY